jgi:hypothetical protein
MRFVHTASWLCVALSGLMSACSESDPETFFPSGSGGDPQVGGAGSVETGGAPAIGGGAGEAPAAGGDAGAGTGGVPSAGAGGQAGAVGGGPATGGSAGGGPVTVLVTEFEDTWVDDCNPDDVNGADATLLVDADPCVYEIYLRPLLEIPAGASIESATLFLNCVNPGNQVDIYTTSGDWTESALSWNDRPPLGDLVSSIMPELGSVEIDLTEQLQLWTQSSTAASIVLTTESINGSDYSSSEAEAVDERPHLSVTYVP